jgi:hypothetical protein
LHWVKDGSVFEFDILALQAALDGERRARGLTWDALAAEINQPFKHTPSIPISLGTIRTMTTKRSVTSAVVLQVLRWLRRTPESFLAGRDQAPAPAEELPGAGPSQILRFDTAAIHAVLDAKRREQGMTWSEVVREIPGFTASMLTNLANGPLIGFPRVMALPQWLGRPASDFVRAACADGGSERRGLERIAFRRHHPHGSRRLRGARITRWRRRAASPSGQRDPE